MTDESLLRVSVATYNQVIFPHPENGMTMLALERKATILPDGSVNVRAQPFGGGVRILNSNSLTKLLGEVRYDTERSKGEGDFRILIPPAKWEAVKRYCLLHLANSDDRELESTPERELVEEFEETMRVVLKWGQYAVEPMGFVIEDNPVWTENWYSRGSPTVRVYRTYKTQILDPDLCKILLDISVQVSDEELGMRALKNNARRANSVLTLPLDKVLETFLTIPAEKRFNKIEVNHHMLDESVLVVLEDIEVSEYLRL